MDLIDWPESGAAVMHGETYHTRHGGPDNAFVYQVDYVLLRLAPSPGGAPFPFGYGRFGPVSYSDRDHGDGKGHAVDWARRHATEQGLPDVATSEIWLLTQPRRFGYVFNPVSFWFFRDPEGCVRAVLVEVNNTFGDRHSYFCALPDYGPIDQGAPISRPKRMHVSPFQDVAGDYGFRFRMAASRVSILIEHKNGDAGMTAALSGNLAPLNRRAALGLLVRRPLGALRVFSLIHWQAVKLAVKGAAFRRRPTPPNEEIS